MKYEITLGVAYDDHSWDEKVFFEEGNFLSKAVEKAENKLNHPSIVASWLLDFNEIEE